MATNEENRCLLLDNQCKQNREATAGEKATEAIELLNDDCLIDIFTLLTPADRTRIERVCARWNCLSKKSWNNFNYIDDVFIKTAKVAQNKKNENFCLALNGVLSRSGKCVKMVKIDFSLVSIQQLIDLIFCLIHYCENLEHFAIHEEHYEELLCGPADKLFRPLFERNRKLRILVISRVEGLTGECLMALEGKNLTEINLFIDSGCMKMDLLQQAFANFVNLRILCIKAESLFIDAVLKVAANLRECKIEELAITRTTDVNDDLGNEEEATKPKYSKYFSKMTSLVKITLTQITEINCFLKALPAKSLNTINLLHFVTKDYAEFLSFLKKCKNLEKFILHVDKKTKENPFEDELFDSLSHCGKLNTLYIVNCKNISNTGIDKLVNMPDLKKLLVGGSPIVTEDFLMSKFQHLEAVKFVDGFV